MLGILEISVSLGILPYAEIVSLDEIAFANFTK